MVLKPLSADYSAEPRAAAAPIQAEKDVGDNRIPDYPSSMLAADSFESASVRERVLPSVLGRTWS